MDNLLENRTTEAFGFKRAGEYNRGDHGQFAASGDAGAGASDGNDPQTEISGRAAAAEDATRGVLGALDNEINENVDPGNLSSHYGNSPIEEAIKEAKGLRSDLESIANNESPVDQIGSDLQDALDRADSVRGSIEDHEQLNGESKYTTAARSRLDEIDYFLKEALKVAP